MRAAICLGWLAMAVLCVSVNGRSNSISAEKKKTSAESTICCTCNSAVTQAPPASTQAPASTAQPSTESTSTGSSSTGSSSSASSSSPISSTPSSSCNASDVDMSGETCPCQLLQEFKNVQRCKLDATEQAAFEVCLVDIRGLLNAQAKSGKDKYRQIAHRMKKCLKKNKSIEDKIRFEKFTLIEGSVNDVCATGQAIDADYSDELTASDSDGNNNITRAIEDGTKNDACGAGTTVVMQDITKKCKKMFKKQTPGCDKGRKLGWFKKLLKYVNQTDSQLAACVRNITITGFGTIDQLEGLCERYEVAGSMGTEILLGSAGQTTIEKSLQQGKTQCSCSVSELAEYDQLTQKITTYFSSDSSIEGRRKFVSAQYSQCSDSLRYKLKKVAITGVTFSTDLVFADVIDSCHFVTNEGGVNVTYGSPAGDYPSACAVDTATNTSTVDEIIDAWMANCTPMQRTQYNSYYKSKKACIHAQPVPVGYTNDLPGRAACVKYYTKGYANTLNTQLVRKQQFLKMEVFDVFTETTTSIKFGTNDEGYCGCS